MGSGVLALQGFIASHSYGTMFLALLIAAGALIILAIVMKNWILGAIAVALVIVALLLGGGHGLAISRSAAPTPVLVRR